MFDYVRSSYDLGPDFTNVECQTKDIDDSGIGGSMSHYWIAPDGRLYVSTYRSTHTFEVIKEDDPRYSETHKFLNFEWIPTGDHGKVEPYYLTKYVEIYTAQWKGDWVDWPRMRLHFKDGILQDFEAFTRKIG